jgi:hypothetical protein
MNNKDLISQYADSGMGIPEYQYNKLPSNDKKTYIRKRGIASLRSGGELYNYEYRLMSNEVKLDFMKNKLSRNNDISSEMYNDTPIELRLEYLKIKIDRGYYLTDQEYSDASDDLKMEYIKKRVSRGLVLTDQEYSDASDNLKLSYLKMKIKYGVELNDEEIGDYKRLNNE